MHNYAASYTLNYVKWQPGFNFDKIYLFGQVKHELAWVITYKDCYLGWTILGKYFFVLRHS